MQINDDKKNFFKSIILLYKSVSNIKIKSINLTNKKDFKIGLISIGKFFSWSLRKPGYKKWKVVDKKKYKKNIITNQVDF